MNDEPKALDRADPGLDADEIDAILGGAGQDEPTSSSDPRPTSSPLDTFKRRLFSTSPDPSLEDVETDGLFNRKNAAAFAKRGLGKFTGAGSTALEDFVSAGLAWIWGDETDSEPNDYNGGGLDTDGLEDRR